VSSGFAWRPQLVVFDLDGTLIDSRKVMLEAFCTAFEETGGEGTAPVHEFLSLLGAPFPSILEALGLPSEMDSVFRRLAGERIDQITLHEGAVDASRRLKDAGTPVALLTGKDRKRTQAILHYWGLKGLFDDLVCGDDPLAGKPDPEGLLHLCEALGAEPRSTIMIGDSALDITSGRRANAMTVGCLWGMGQFDELRSAGADHLVADAVDLTTLLEHWCGISAPRVLSGPMLE
jgi:AHBA synthesis associated protein